MKAIWNGKIIAESNETVVVEGNHYFPKESINCDYFEETDTNTVCGWKGTASYFTINVDGKKNVDAAWYYPEAKDAAKEIENYVAFWKGVEITDK